MAQTIECPIEQLPVEFEHATISHTKPQFMPLVYVNCPDMRSGEAMLSSEVLERLAVIPLGTSTPVAEPKIAPAIF